jgi:hypothetical protein
MISKWSDRVVCRITLLSQRGAESQQAIAFAKSINAFWNGFPMSISPSTTSWPELAALKLDKS